MSAISICCVLGWVRMVACSYAVTHSCLSVCDPTDCNPPGSSVPGFPRQEYWSGLLSPTPGDLPEPEIEPRSPALAGRFLTTMPLRKCC